MKKMTDPRPMCRECGAIVHPATAYVFVDTEPVQVPDKFGIHLLETGDPLVGIYCSEDCILNAIDRGYPAHAVQDDSGST